MRVVYHIDPLLKLLLDLPRGNFAVFRKLFSAPPGHLFNRRVHLFFPARTGRREFCFEKPPPSNFSDSGRGGDLLAQLSCRLIHLREARLDIRGAKIHLFLPELDFVRRRLR